MFIRPGARDLLLQAEREKFLTEEWPRVYATMQRLGLSPQALLAAVQEIAADRSVRAVLLKGAGRAFVAGGDLATLQANPVQGAQDLLEPLNAAVTLLHGLDAPVIAQVHGYCLGGALGIMNCHDLVYAAEDAELGMPEILRAASASSSPRRFCTVACRSRS